MKSTANVEHFENFYLKEKGSQTESYDCLKKYREERLGQYFFFDLKERKRVTLCHHQ